MWFCRPADAGRLFHLTPSGQVSDRSGAHGGVFRDRGRCDGAVRKNIRQACRYHGVEKSGYAEETRHAVASGRCRIRIHMEKPSKIALREKRSCSERPCGAHGGIAPACAKELFFGPAPSYGKREAFGEGAMAWRRLAEETRAGRAFCACSGRGLSISVNLFARNRQESVTP